MHLAGIIQCMCPANERQCNTVTLSLLGWAYTQNDPWFSNELKLTSIWKYIYYLSNVWQVSQGYNYWQITASDSGFVHTYATSNYLKQVTTSLTYMPWVNTLRLRGNLCHFKADIFKCIFLNENIWISLQIALKFVPKVRIDKIPALVQIMAWRWPGDKPLSEPMVVSLLMHICITQLQIVKTFCFFFFFFFKECINWDKTISNYKYPSTFKSVYYKYCTH